MTDILDRLTAPTILIDEIKEVYAAAASEIRALRDQISGTICTSTAPSDILGTPVKVKECI